MTFRAPGFFFLLLLLPLVLLPLRVPGLPFQPLHLAEEGPRARRFRWLSPFLGGWILVWLVMALAGPQLPGRWIEEKTYGIDILLALDLSGSMRAEDFQPQNRLGAAKGVLRDFIERHKGHRIGLVAFAGRALTISPLTTDTGMLLEALESLDFQTIKEDGTAIGDAIATCVNRLAEEGAKSRCIVLLTDGQNNSGMIDPRAAAGIAAKKAIKLYAIAAGKPGGAPVPYLDSFGHKQYLHTRDGALYLTKIDEGSLLSLAQIGRGAFFRAHDTQGLEEAYRQIDKLERSPLAAGRKRTEEDKRGIPLFLALLGLLIEGALAIGPWRILGRSHV